MNVIEAIRTLLAVRDYAGEPISEDAIAALLESARLTGSSRNRQTWHFVVVRDGGTLKRLGELAVTGGYIGVAAAAIAVLVPGDWPGPFDAGRAVQNIMLTAWEMGIGSNVVTNTDTPEIRALLNVPDDLAVLTIIPLGYPVKKTGKGRKARKPLSEIAHRERFGQPYP